MNIVGLDICKDSVVAVLVDDSLCSTEPRQLYYDLEFHKLNATNAGLKALLDLNPDVAVLEPTGVNYSRLWVTKLAEAGIEIRLVGHQQLRSYRINLGLPDKDDCADALALALYFYHHHCSPNRFVRTRDPVISQIRDRVLRLHHLNRVQSPVINRLRQDLVWQFPERSNASLHAKLFWRWLAGEARSARYDLELERSIGLGIETETRNHARLLVELQRREMELEAEIRLLINCDRFLPYRRIMKEFGFGERSEALILSQIYPLENYLVDGKPEIRIRKGRHSGKPTKRYLSERRFMKALGIAPRREESGDKKASMKAGSTLCRTALWQWIFTRINPKKARPKTEIGEELGRLLDVEKSCKPIKLARSRVAAKAVKLLFRRLVAALTAPDDL